MQTRQPLDGLVHHFDRGVQYLNVRYSERLAENDIVASVGSKGGSYANAMAEAFNSLDKWELIYPSAPGGASTTSSTPPCGYIDWFNHGRLHGEITDDNTYITPAEFEALYYRQNLSRPTDGHPIEPAVTKPGAVQNFHRRTASNGARATLVVERVGHPSRRGR